MTKTIDILIMTTDCEGGNMETGIFEIKRNVAGSCFFIFKDQTNNMIAVSQSFPDRSALEKCISMIRKWINFMEVSDSEQIDRNTSSLSLFQEENGGYSFVLTGLKNEMILRSEVYLDKNQCEAAILYFKRNAGYAQVVDQTSEY